MLAAEDKKSYKTDALVFKTLYYGAERSSKLYIRVPLYRCTSMYIDSGQVLFQNLFLTYSPPILGRINVSDRMSVVLNSIEFF